MYIVRHDQHSRRRGEKHRTREQEGRARGKFCRRRDKVEQLAEEEGKTHFKGFVPHYRGRIWDGHTEPPAPPPDEKNASLQAQLNQQARQASRASQGGKPPWFEATRDTGAQDKEGGRPVW